MQEAGFVTFFGSFLLCFLGCCILSVFPFCSDCTKVSLCAVQSLPDHSIFLGKLACTQDALAERLRVSCRTGCTGASAAGRSLAGSAPDYLLMESPQLLGLALALQLCIFLSMLRMW